MSKSTQPVVPFNEATVDDVLSTVNDKFFTVVFLKKDGTLRKMNCRKGVKIGVYGTGSKSTNDDQIRVYDVKNKAWRSFLKSRVVAIRFKKEYRFV